MHNYPHPDPPPPPTTTNNQISKIKKSAVLKPCDVPLYYFSQSLRRKKAITLSSYVKKISYYMHS